MDRVADREIFVAVYPNGTGLLGKRLLTWNAGTCCAYSVINNVDDVGFVRALVADLARRIPIDRSRVYATGLSNGGMMSQLLAIELTIELDFSPQRHSAAKAVTKRWNRVFTTETQVVRKKSLFAKISSCKHLISFRQNFRFL